MGPNQDIKVPELIFRLIIRTFTTVHRIIGVDNRPKQHVIKATSANIYCAPLLGTQPSLLGPGPIVLINE